MAATSTPARQPPMRALDALLALALASGRSSPIAPVTRQRRHLSAWTQSTWLAPVWGSLGDLLEPTRRDAQAVAVLMPWALAQLRPDGRPGLHDIEPRHWLWGTPWRPLLALACQHGWLDIPLLPEATHYRPRSEHSAAERLCGLWRVGASTYYRHVERGRERLLALLARAPDAAQRLALRAHALAVAQEQHTPPLGWPAWHRHQAARAAQAGGVADALWHLHQAGDTDRLLELLRQRPLEAARSPETDPLLAALAGPAGMPMVDVCLAQAQLWRTRHDEAAERAALERAQRAAGEQADALRLGRVHLELALFYETRDGDRAIAAASTAVAQLRRAVDAGPATERAQATATLATALVRLAFLHLRRKDPQAQALLRAADALAAAHFLPADVEATLAQTWGEYWRCEGDCERALAHAHQALLLHEQVGNARAVLSSCRNLSLLYGEARNPVKAIEYGQRVIDAAQRGPVEPELLASAHGNLGLNHYHQGDWGAAIAEYQRVVDIVERAGLRAHLGVSHYNLAEAHYSRFARTASAQDEQLGDHHRDQAVAIGQQDNNPALVAAAETLKADVLACAPVPDNAAAPAAAALGSPAATPAGAATGTPGSDACERLQTSAYAAHPEAMARIDTLRADLVLAQTPEAQARIRLAMAAEHLAMAASERERALAVLHAAGLPLATCHSELDALRSTFERALSEEERVSARWKELADAVIGVERRSCVLARLFAHGHLTKRSYGEATGVAPATASKHLAWLRGAGLLAQSGAGPSTRYTLAPR